MCSPSEIEIATLSTPKKLTFLLSRRQGPSDFPRRNSLIQFTWRNNLLSAAREGHTAEEGSKRHESFHFSKHSKVFSTHHFVHSGRTASRDSWGSPCVSGNFSHTSVLLDCKKDNVNPHRGKRISLRGGWIIAIRATFAQIPQHFNHKQKGEGKFYLPFAFPLLDPTYRKLIFQDLP